MTLCGACLEGLASREHRTESHMMGSVSYFVSCVIHLKQQLLLGFDVQDAGAKFEPKSRGQYFSEAMLSAYIASHLQ